MFNFNLMNRALKDAELKDAFRMLYYIVNKCSLKNSMSVEIFDAEFELALSISPRSTCRFTKKLEERGYIKKEVRGTSQNKLANIYTLINIDIKDDKIDTLTDNANIDGSSDGRIDTLKNNNKINKNNNIFLSNNINIPDTDIDNINVDNTDEVFLSNFMKVDNINVDNSNTETKNLRIEENINLNNENEMNEERMNEMNNIINSNENDINTSTKSLEDILTEQSDEFNNIIQFMNNSVVDTDEVNTSDNYKNISVEDTNEVNTSNKFMNISVEEQKRYQRLFNKCKSQIEIWMKTHEYSCISMFDAYFEAIQDMNDEHLISVKQWNAAQRYLFQRFNNLRNGYNNYIQNKNKTISSNEVNECNNPRPPRQQNDQMEEVV